VSDDEKHSKSFGDSIVSDTDVQSKVLYQKNSCQTRKPQKTFHYSSLSNDGMHNVLSD
jgi:hypothetical protein